MQILVSGIVPGIILTVCVGRVAQTLLYGTHASDPGPLLFAVTVLLVSGVTASLIPARRAAFLDPVQALRAE